MLETIEKKTRCINYCYIFSTVLSLGMITVIIILSVAYGNDSSQIRYYQSLVNPSCDGIICPGKTYQSKDRQSCCYLSEADCQTKSYCIHVHIQSLTQNTQNQSIFLTASSTLTLMFIISSIVFCKRTKRTIQILRNLQEFHQPYRSDIESRLNYSTNGENDWDRQHLRQSFLYNNSQKTCPICLENFSNQKAAFLGCGHLFHSQCIQDWSAVKNTCPVCRSSQ